MVDLSKTLHESLRTIVPRQVKHCIRRGVDINDTYIYGCTPLSYAINQYFFAFEDNPEGHEKIEKAYKIIEMLCDAGADVFKPNIPINDRELPLCAYELVHELKNCTFDGNGAEHMNRVVNLIHAYGGYHEMCKCFE
jgi:hypothetical protein